jgi:FdrA protein
MIVLGDVRRGIYHDSVALMRAGKDLLGLAGVLDAALMMGTAANRAILRSAGLHAAAFDGARDADLLVAVKARDEASARGALAAVDGLLKRAGRAGGGEPSAPNPRDFEGALRVLPGANLALISVAGRHAGREALEALRHGLHVMIFSDHVPLETEIRLKRTARSKGLLVMGPDCGTAIINGVPLAFANNVRRGDIGVVAAAGTGLQEVSCLIHHAGSGISQAIGTGGRDVARAVGGITFVQGIRALEADPGTRVILLVAKPPDPSVLRSIERALRGVRKPVVRAFVGAARPGCDPATLEEAALAAAALSRGRPAAGAARRLAARDARLRAAAARDARGLARGRRCLRGLFSGGTFCAEAQVLLGGVLRDLHSNAPTGRTKPLRDPLKSRGNTILDLGADTFTAGRPHPMIDFSLRMRRLLDEARDPETAVVLLDVVLGHGAHPDPASELVAPVTEAARAVAVVCSVTGTDADPQSRAKVIRVLRAAGARILSSNAAACVVAGEIARRAGGRA